MTEPDPTPPPPTPPGPAQDPPTAPAAPPTPPPKSEPDWKAEARKWEDRAKENKTAADELATIKAAQMTAEQKAQADLEAANQRATALLDRTVKAEIRSLAAEGFADPNDAHLYLDLSKYTGADGEIDPDAIKADLATVLTAKPHLAKATRPAGQVDQGVQGSGTSGVGQLTEDDVKKLAAAGKHAEIEQARVAGQLNTLLGIT